MKNIHMFSILLTACLFSCSTNKYVANNDSGILNSETKGILYQSVCGLFKFNDYKNNYLGIVTLPKSDGYGQETDIKIIKNTGKQTPWPAWSKDRNKIAFLSKESGKTEIWIMDINDDKAIKITKNGKEKKYLVWNHQGDKIYYLQKGNDLWSIAEVNILTGHINIIREGSNYADPEIYPDDKKIIFCKITKDQRRDNKEYWLDASIFMGDINKPETDEKLMPNLQGIMRGPKISKNGRMLLFEYSKLWKDKVPTSCIMVYDFGSQKYYQATDDSDDCWGGGWTTDNQKFLCLTKNPTVLKKMEDLTPNDLTTCDADSLIFMKWYNIGKKIYMPEIVEVKFSLGANDTDFIKEYIYRKLLLNADYEMFVGSWAKKTVYPWPMGINWQ